jgi:hypothetical protein
LISLIFFERFEIIPAGLQAFPTFEAANKREIFSTAQLFSGGKSFAYSKEIVLYENHFFVFVYYSPAQRLLPGKKIIAASC